ncbi:MAG: DUF4382 domain-containing protein [Nitrososphaerota archaeon]|nr:DUF4382 domain-containing protein [Nitrososphaerota archaeon]MDG6923335.1 DUF4382 domain-containing protein [Nitrososphaerota archaeon]
MSGRRTISVIAVGVLLAASIIGGVTVLQEGGVLPALTTGGTTHTSTGHTSTSGTTTSSSTSKSASSASGSGTLILQIHDPPNVPTGVTSVFVTYSNISLGSDVGWINLDQTGTINLMTVVNFTQTIANQKVPAGTYDLIMMTINSVMVTWNSANYSASITNNRLTIPIIGNLTISNQGASGSVIDISPTVLEHMISNNTGQYPSFVMVSSANAYIVPSNQLGQQSQIGDREDVSNQTWLTNQINETAKHTAFAIVSASISNSSFVVAVKNTGNRSVFIQSVFIAVNGSQPQSYQGEGYSNIVSSVVFTVMSNGTLVPYGSKGTENVGYNLSAHSQTIFSYWGQIPPVQNFGESSDSGSTTTRSTTSTLSNTTSRDDFHSGPAPLDSGSINSSNGFKIVKGQSYLVGATSGDFTSTLVIVAS